MTSTDGIVIDGRLIKRGDMSGPKSAQMVLQNPTVDTAVFEVARGGILREGLGYDRNDVAVVTNVTGDHLGLGGIDTLGQLANVKGVLVEAVPRVGDRGAQRGRRARVPDGPPLRRARRAVLDGQGRRARTATTASTATPSRGNAAFCLEDTPQGELMVLRHGPRKMPVLYTHLMPGDVRRAGADERGQRAGRGRRRPGRPGAHLHDIRQGLRTFTTSFFQAPGRLNLVEVGGDARGHRLLPQRGRHAPAGRLREPDDGRAADAAGRWARPARRTRRTGRAIGVIGIPGDRRDQDQRDYGALAATAFDEIIIREDRNLRGREPGRDGGERRGRRQGRRGPRARPDALAGREDPRRGGGGARRRSGARRRATSWWSARTTRSASTGRR